MPLEHAGGNIGYPAKVCTLEVYCTTMACMPNAKGADNLLAIGCGDGFFRQGDIPTGPARGMAATP